MSDDAKTKPADHESVFSRMVGAQASRKARAQRSGKKNTWLGLGMSGLIGWSVAVPTLIGAAAGRWLDMRHPTPYSWTLMLLFLGLVIGCLSAWHWVASEFEEMREVPDE